MYSNLDCWSVPDLHETNCLQTNVGVTQHVLRNRRLNWYRPARPKLFYRSRTGVKSYGGGIVQLLANELLTATERKIAITCAGT